MLTPTLTPLQDPLSTDIASLSLLFLFPSINYPEISTQIPYLDISLQGFQQFNVLNSRFIYKLNEHRSTELTFPDSFDP